MASIINLLGKYFELDKLQVGDGREEWIDGCNRIGLVCLRIGLMYMRPELIQVASSACLESTLR